VSVTEAGEGQSGRAAVGSGSYDVVLVVQDTGVESGLALIGSLVAGEGALEGEAVPQFVLIGGYGEGGVEAAARRLGISTLTRPVRASTLLNALCGISTRTEPPLLLEETAEPIGLHQRVGGCHLLVADDHPVNRLIIRDMLTNIGFAVDTASNGLEAVNMVQRTRYAAVLMDCHMPVMDGLEATRAIRSNLPLQPELPIIAITANVTRGYQERCLAAGMNDYLSKPFRLGQLVEMLNRSVIPYTLSEGDGGEAPSGNEEGGDEEPFVDAALRAVFIETTAEGLTALASAVVAGDAEQAMILAHRMKGAAAMCEEREMSGLAGRIERHAKAEELVEAGALLDELRLVFDRYANES
jgi:CheY-like chemotaxis protein